MLSLPAAVAVILLASLVIVTATAAITKHVRCDERSIVPVIARVMGFVMFALAVNITLMAAS